MTPTDFLHHNGSRSPTVVCQGNQPSLSFPFHSIRINLERAKGIEPSQPVWKTDILPLNYARNKSGYFFPEATPLKLAGVAYTIKGSPGLLWCRTFTDPPGDFSSRIPMIANLTSLPCANHSCVTPKPSSLPLTSPHS